MLAGDPAAAERRLLEGYRALEEMGDKAFLSTTAAYLAQAVYAQGRDEEAGRYTEISEELASRDDLLTQVIWRSVRAGFLARQGRIEEAEDARAGGGDDGRVDRLRHHPGRRADGAGGDPVSKAGRVEEATSAATDGPCALRAEGQQRGRREDPGAPCRLVASVKRYAAGRVALARYPNSNELMRLGMVVLDACQIR